LLKKNVELNVVQKYVLNAQSSIEAEEVDDLNLETVDNTSPRQYASILIQASIEAARVD